MGRRGPFQGPINCGESPECIVLRASAEANVRWVEEAVRNVGRLYWTPFYKFIRARGYTEGEAQVLTEEFFLHLPEFLPRTPPARWTFRRLLLDGLKQFFFRRRATRFQVHRAPRTLVSAAEFAEEERLGLPLADPITPQQVFNLRWALSLSDRAVECVRAEYYGCGKGALYEALKNHYPGETGALTYAALGERMQMTGPATRAAMLRLRARYQEMLQEEIARTVCGAAELKSEVKRICNLLRGAGGE
jgi:RNA polymerase sigma-70 factor (ECF subfamily)